MMVFKHNTLSKKSAAISMTPDDNAEGGGEEEEEEEEEGAEAADAGESDGDCTVCVSQKNVLSAQC